MIFYRFWSLRRSPIVLLTFWKIISRCSLKSNPESKTIPRCIWDSIKLTALRLKIKHEWLVFWSFRLKKTSCVCLVRSGLKFISIGMSKCLFWLTHYLTRWLIWLYFLPQKIMMYHPEIILYWKLNHQISRLCIIEEAMVQV